MPDSRTFRTLFALGLLALSAACSGGDETPPRDEQFPLPPSPPAATRVEAPGTYEVRYFELDKSCPYCRDLRRLIAEGGASGEPALEKLYEGKVRFVVKPGFDSRGDPVKETELFAFGGAAHGFAGIAPDGTVKFTSPGHHQTRGELITLIDAMLH